MHLPCSPWSVIAPFACTEIRSAGVPSVGRMVHTIGVDTVFSDLETPQPIALHFTRLEPQA